MALLKIQKEEKLKGNIREVNSLLSNLGWKKKTIINK